MADLKQDYKSCSTTCGGIRSLHTQQEVLGADGLFVCLRYGGDLEGAAQIPCGYTEHAGSYYSPQAVGSFQGLWLVGI